MTNEDKKKISERPLLVFWITFLSQAVFLAVLAFFGRDFPKSVGNHYLYGGAIVTIIGFAFINKGGSRWSSGVAHKKNDKLFKKIRAEEKPFEQIIWSVIFAGVSIVAIGFLLNKIFVG